jgi:hypothetical protein
VAPRIVDRGRLWLTNNIMIQVDRFVIG